MAPKGNKNALTHGMNAGGSLPAGCSAIQKQLLQFKDIVEQAAKERFGEPLDLYVVCCWETACSYYRKALLARKWLRDSAATMSNGEKLKFAEAEARAFEQRDLAIKRMGLDRLDIEERNTIYALPVLPDDPLAEPAEPADDAAGGLEANAPPDLPG